MRRRTVLASAGSLLTLGGCLSPGTTGQCEWANVPQGGLQLRNWDDAERTVDVTVFFDLLVTRQIAYEETLHLSAESAYDDEPRRLDAVVDRIGRHVVRATVRETGATTDYLWEVSETGCTGLILSVQDGRVSISGVETDGGSSNSGGQF